MAHEPAIMADVRPDLPTALAFLKQVGRWTGQFEANLRVHSRGGFDRKASCSFVLIMAVGAVLLLRAGEGGDAGRVRDLH